MKKIMLWMVAGFAFCLLTTSCSTSFLMISADENFDALTKITDGRNPAIFPNGGDSAKNLAFCMKEEGGYYNIYLKDNVFTSSFIKKTDGQNINLVPNYNKATNRIVFQYWDKDNFDIYYIDALKGKAISQVTNTDENEYSPAWSPDGKKIVFEKGAPPKFYYSFKQTSSKKTLTGTGITGGTISVTNNQIWIKDLQTSELKMVGQGSYPKFSPDGNSLVFVKYDLNKGRTQETGTIWTMSVDGENQRQLTDANLGYAILPNWSPDGKTIVFQLTKTKKKDSDIYTIDINGENLKQYTKNKSSDFSPYWSADHFIFFASDRGAKALQYQIWRFKITQ